MRLADFLDMDELEIARHFTGAYGVKKMREAIKTVQEAARQSKIVALHAPLDKASDNAIQS